jgi:hypothetical protein
LAAAAGCDPLAVELIRRHQEQPAGVGYIRCTYPLPTVPPGEDRHLVNRLLAALQDADDDN